MLQNASKSVGAGRLQAFEHTFQPSAPHVEAGGMHAVECSGSQDGMTHTSVISTIFPAVIRVRGGTVA